MADVDLHAREWGQGGRVAVLLHGMMGSADSWHRVGPVLAARGYRVIALDLPGHGRSPADLALTVDRAAAHVVDTVRSLADDPPALAVGHSYGGLVLAAALPRLAPLRAVVVDSPTEARGGHDFEYVKAQYAEEARQRTYDWLRSTRSFYSEADALVEAEAARLFDPDTAAAVSSSAGGSWPLPEGAMMIRPARSPYVPDDATPALERAGVIVRTIEGAAHTVWYSHFDEFIDTLFT